MTNVADATPGPGQAQPPARSSIRGLLAPDGDRSPSVRHGGRPDRHPGHVPRPERRQAYSPTNMVTMAVQATGIAIIATGMVLVIVSRNIDLSVGSLAGLIAMVYALLMTDWFPAIFGIGRRRPLPVGDRPGDRGGYRGPRRSRTGFHHRLHRRAVVHRARSAACCRSAASSGTSRRAPRSRVWTPTSSDRRRGARARSARR